jgi:hypothetical protein
VTVLERRDRSVNQLCFARAYVKKYLLHGIQKESVSGSSNDSPAGARHQGIPLRPTGVIN